MTHESLHHDMRTILIEPQPQFFPVSSSDLEDTDLILCD